MTFLSTAPRNSECDGTAKSFAQRPRCSPLFPPTLGKVLISLRLSRRILGVPKKSKNLESVNNKVEKRIHVILLHEQLSKQMLRVKFRGGEGGEWEKIGRPEEEGKLFSVRETALSIILRLYYFVELRASPTLMNYLLKHMAGEARRHLPRSSCYCIAVANVPNFQDPRVYHVNGRAQIRRRQL